MNTKQYTTPENAAKNITELIDFLSIGDKTVSFVYRGQTKEYNSPLFPSAFRLLLSTKDNRIDKTHKLFKYSTRNCGNIFYGDLNYKIQLSTSLPFASLADSQKEVVRNVFNKVLNSSSIANSQITSRFRGDFLQWFDLIDQNLTREEYSIFLTYIANSQQCLRVIDRYHRRMIRNFFFYYFFGFIVGTALSQQYGISSDGLDATTSIDVAAFFATHDSSNDYLHPLNEGIGIIYRIPFESHGLTLERINSTDYNSIPNIIDISSLLLTIENDNIPLHNMMHCFQSFCSNIESGREKVCLSRFLPSGIINASRIGRQKAVIIYPDEIRKDQQGALSGVDGITKSQFRYIEDISARSHFDKFYFYHSGKMPNNFKITRNYLWPRTDPFLQIVCPGITAPYPLNMFRGAILPYRLDLIDSGYDKTSFLKICETIAKNNLFLGYFTQDEIKAISNGVMMI